MVGDSSWDVDEAPAMINVATTAPMGIGGRR